MKELFTSRRFWATVIVLIILVVGQFMPSFAIDQEAGAGLAVIVVSYVVGLSVDPGPGGWRGVLQSRKFWAAAIGLTLIFLTGFGVKLPFGLTEDILVEFAAMIGGYIGSVALQGKLPAFHPTR